MKDSKGKFILINKGGESDRLPIDEAINKIREDIVKPLSNFHFYEIDKILSLAFWAAATWKNKHDNDRCATLLQSLIDDISILGSEYFLELGHSTPLDIFRKIKVIENHYLDVLSGHVRQQEIIVDFCDIFRQKLELRNIKMPELDPYHYGIALRAQMAKDFSDLGMREFRIHAKSVYFTSTKKEEQTIASRIKQGFQLAKYVCKGEKEIPEDVKLKLYYYFVNQEDVLKWMKVHFGIFPPNG